jgi:hypothetical protein|tara:strand:- start:54 stop:209 length:156 start_codon:yes stop_codon:yes gene_type:complete
MIKILEVPIYLLIIASYSFESGNIVMAIFLAIMSLVRLWLNHITHDINNKK